MITGVSSDGDNFIFSGYNSSFVPFLIFTNENRPPGLDIFSGNPERINLVGDSFLETGSQVEGITFFDFNKCYISREFSSFTIGGMTFQFPQKLYVFSSYLFNLLSNSDFELSKSIKIVPNPVNDDFKILLESNHEQIKSIIIYNNKGQEVYKTVNTDTIQFLQNTKGVYFVKIEFYSGKSGVKKIVKN